MNPHLATALCLAGIGGLFYLNRGRKVSTSAALWIPVLWLAIASSRMVSQWLAIMGLTTVPTGELADRYMEGSPLDRLLLAVVFIAGVAVLVGRRRKVAALLRNNLPIVIFFLYCGLSIAWSDYSSITFKRYIKALSDLTMVLIVLTDGNPWGAIRKILTRVGFFLIPLSIVLIKYYPAMGRGYSEWGESAVTGVATSKNELGGLCLIFGVACLWRLVQSRPAKQPRVSAGVRIANVTVLAMGVWLLWLGNAVTAMSCLAMASILVLACSSKFFLRRLWLVHAIFFGCIGISCLALFFSVGGGLVQSIGRDPTLTGRTDIWKLVIGMANRPLLGTGFESFWLGSRLDAIWKLYWWHPNEAHNGYIDVFLTLGWIGIALVGMLFLSAYWKVMKALRHNPQTAKLRLAYLLIAVIYNFTESAVRIMHPVWIVFLLAAMAPMEIQTAVKPSVAEAKPELEAEKVPSLQAI
jgi:exopolysaccharide production protein ExoQ